MSPKCLALSAESGFFFHYYFCSVHDETHARTTTGGATAANVAADEKASLFLDETDGWLEKYKPGSMRAELVITRARGALVATLVAGRTAER